MTAEAKIAQGKMTLLQLAERLRNVSEACRRRGVSRSQFYEYKRAFQEQGFQALWTVLPYRGPFPMKRPLRSRRRSSPCPFPIRHGDGRGYRVSSCWMGSS